jgi:predicted phosphodiesterase
VISFDDARPLMVFGGPYSNLAATLALRAEAERLSIPPERIVCTGDVVAYCAEPEETTALVRSWGIHVVAGNCEEQLAAGAADCGCNFEEGTACDLLAKGWYPFAAARITPESRAWMAGLPTTLHFSFGGLRFRVVHGGTEVINRWVFASTGDVLDEELARADCDVVIAGHCGLPFVTARRGGVWFNPGVIGMPANDGTPDVWYGLIESTGAGVRLSTRRLSYDFRAAAASVRRFRYADGYARALVTGLWPSLDVLPETERAKTGAKVRAVSKLVPERDVPGLRRATALRTA